MTERIVEAEGLVKRYNLTASDGSTWWPSPGRCWRCWAPTVPARQRSSGRSRRCSGHVAPGGGARRREPQAVRRTIGLAGSSPREPALSGRENLPRWWRVCSARDRRAARANSTEVLERLGLAEDGDRLVRTYSGGMRRKLDLGASLVGSPGCCCSTSRRPASIHGAASSCGTPSADGRAGNRRPADDAVPGRGRSPGWSRDHRPRPSGRHRDAERAQASRRPQRGRGTFGTARSS